MLLSATAYLNSLEGTFVYDDSEIILRNENVRGRTTLLQMFFDRDVMPFSGEIYRPLRDLSYRLDWLIGGRDPLVYHATNVFLHMLTTIAAYWFLILLVKDGTVALMASALFAVHPLHTESVAWIKGRDDILFTLFYLLSFGMFLLYEGEMGRKRRLFYYSSLLLFVFSLFSKEMAVTLPIAIAIYQVVFNRLRLPTLIPFLFTAIVYMGLRTYILGQTAQTEYWGGGAVPTMLTMVKGVFQYLRLSLLPVNQCADYLSFPVSQSFDWEVFLSLSFILIFLACLFLAANKVVIWGGLFFFLTLLPVLNIIPIKILIAERFLCLPVLGICLSLASGFALVLPGRGRWIAGGLLILMLFSLTIQRNLVWRDEYSLWSDTLRKAPANGRAHYGMGTAYDSKGMPEEAISEYEKAIRTGFYSPNVLNALALAYYKKGSGGEAYDERLIDGAIRLYKKALEIEKTHRDARYNLAILYQERGVIDEAIKEYNELLRYEPGDFDALNSLGYAYFQKGLLKEALEHYRKAMAIDPESVSSYNNIGMVYAVSGEMGEAEKWFKKAREIDPNSAEAYYNLGFLYHNMGRLVDAAENYKRALRMRPDYKEAKARLGELEKQ